MLIWIVFFFNKILITIWLKLKKRHATAQVQQVAMNVGKMENFPAHRRAKIITSALEANRIY